MTSQRLIGWSLLCAAITAGLSCGGSDGGTGPSQPDPGPVALVLTTPNTDDGGVLVNITGGAVTSVESVGYQHAFVGSSSGGKLLIRGNLVAGSVVLLNIPDRHLASRYGLQLLQVASRGPAYVQRPLAGYGLVLRQP